MRPLEPKESSRFSSPGGGLWRPRALGIIPDMVSRSVASGPRLLMALLLLDGCGSTAPRPSLRAAPPSAPSWKGLRLSLGERTLTLPFAPAVRPAPAKPRTVLVLVDDSFRAGEDPTQVLSPDWLGDINLVLLPVSQLLAMAPGPADTLLERCAAWTEELGVQLRSQLPSERLVLVADGLTTLIGARVVAREATPFDGYVGASQLTSLSASKVWLEAGVNDPQGGVWWWWPLVRPGKDPPPAEGPLAAFLDAVDRQDLRAIGEVKAPMVLFGGREDPLIPAHHLEIWAGLLPDLSVDVRIIRGGYDLLRAAPQEVRDGVWSVLDDSALIPCAGPAPPRACRSSSSRPWRGPRTSLQGPDDANTRRYDALTGNLTPLPLTASEPQRAMACDPGVEITTWPTLDDHRLLALEWYPESYSGSSKLIPPRSLSQLFVDLERTPPPADGEGGLMVCEVADTRGRGAARGSDVSAVLRIEGEVEVSGMTPDAGRTHLAVPSVKLSPGTGMTVSAKDVNPFLDDHLGSVKLRYEGRWPIEGRNDSLSVTCRAMARPAVLRRLKEDLVRLGRALTRVEETIDGGVIAFPRQTHGDAWRDLEPVVALLGWADPCAHAWLDRFTDTRRRWFEQRLRALSERLREARPKATWVELSDRATLRVTDAICGSPRRGDLETPRPDSFCRVDAQLRNTGQDPVTVEALLGKGLRPNLELANGETVSLVPRDEVPSAGARRGDPPGIMDEVAVLGSPWRRDEGPALNQPFLRLSGRTVAPKETVHLVWLGRAHLSASEVVLGFRPAILRMQSPGGTLRLAL